MARELVISFSDSGYVALFEFEGGPQAGEAMQYVTIIAVRNQREEDYH